MLDLHAPYHHVVLDEALTPCYVESAMTGAAAQREAMLHEVPDSTKGSRAIQSTPIQVPWRLLDMDSMCYAFLPVRSVPSAKHHEINYAMFTQIVLARYWPYFVSKSWPALQVCPLEGCGIQLRVQGFSHKLPLLTRYITHQLATLTAQVGALTLTAKQPCLTL